MISVVVELLQRWQNGWRAGRPSLGALIRSAFSEATAETSRDVKGPNDLRNL